MSRPRRTRDTHVGTGRARSVAVGLAVFAAVLSAGPTDAAAAPPGVETLRVGFATNSRNNVYKIGTWTPVWVQLKGGSERFSGMMEVEVPDDDGTPTFYSQPVDIAPGDGARAVAYVRPGSRDPDFIIRLRDPRGREVSRSVGSTLAQMDPVQSDETVILTLGKPQGVDLVPALPGFSAEKSGGGEVMVVARLDAAGGLVPGRWYGYDAAEAVVVDTNDRDAMDALGVRGQALVDWVDRGGHLVVAVGANWQAVRDSALGPILPAVLAGQERLTTLDGLDTFAGSTNNPITPAGSPPASVCKLDQVESRGGKTLAAVGSVPLVVRGAYGFGRVTLVAVDVDQKPFTEWKDRALFWSKAADIRRVSATSNAGAGAGVRLGGGGARIYQEGVSDLASQLRQSLEQFPGVKLVPFGWVAFFIFIYILLIGPGDYFFLKKVLKRMELTWVTFPLIVAVVSLAAYVAAYAFKGKELRVNKIDVLDIDQTADSPRARGSTFMNMFSPQNRDYGVTVLPQPIDRAPAKGGPPPDPSERPTAGTEVLVSWLGVPEAGFGGMSGSRVGFMGGGYAVNPPGASERLDGVRIPIWSTKCLTARWTGPSPAAVESDLLPVGTDRLTGTVTNRLDVPLEDAILAFNRHMYTLGTLAPGATLRVELSPDRQLPNQLKEDGASFLPGQAWSTQGKPIDRAKLIRVIMFHDTQSVAGAERPLPSDPLHYLDMTGQLALDRPMLVARVDRPACRLALDNAPAPPKIEQTTMLRVILPLSKAK